MHGDSGAIRRHVLENRQRWPALLAFYRRQMLNAAHDHRGADVYGTLLAAADMLLSDADPSGAAAEPWLEMLSAAQLAAESDDEADEIACLNHLLSSTIETSKGVRRTISEVVGYALVDLLINGDKPGESHNCQVLGRHGLRLETVAKPYMLRVANRNINLAGHFKGMRWGNSTGTDGAWPQALRRLKGAEVHASGKFAGVNSRCTAIPLDPYCLALAPNPNMLANEKSEG